MKFEYSIEDNFVIWKYNEFYVVGVEGIPQKPLEELIRLCNNDEIIFSSVKKSSTNFVAAFHFKPPVDITIEQRKDNSTSILTYSLNNNHIKTIN